MIGNYHSIETFSGVDGPGIRYVMFLQGCNMRCKFCHNIDATIIRENKSITVDQVVNDYLKYKSFYSNGGITISGGEPLLQIDFIIELFRKLKEHNVHTCIETQGSLFKNDDKYQELISLTDLFIVDLKGVNDAKALNISGVKLVNTLLFLRHLEGLKKEYFITYVLLPGLNDLEEDIIGISNILSELKSASFTVLPYHKLGISKWEKLNMKYELDVVIPPSNKDVEEFVRQVKSRIIY
ncbi:MAG: pyruvate formate-lyase-activating protein [Bacilli bacterium]